MFGSGPRNSRSCATASAARSRFLTVHVKVIVLVISELSAASWNYISRLFV